MKRIVFLDYDGVVNRKMWYNVDGKWVCRYGYPEDGMVNDVQAVQWVSEFCEKFGYDIVVTSTWRNYPEWENCLRNAGLRESIKILGSTSLPARDRAKEISDYLACLSNVESYLIFDDNVSLFEDDNEDEHHTVFDALGIHSNNLVLCYSERGFGEEEYNMAVALHLRQKHRCSNDVLEISSNGRNLNDLISAAIDLLYAAGELTVSSLQMTFRIGYGRAAEIVDFLVENGIVLRMNKKEQIKYLPLIEYEAAKAKL